MMNEVIAELYRRELGLAYMLSITKIFTGDCWNCRATGVVVNSIPGIEPLCCDCFNLLPEAAEAYLTGDENAKQAYKLAFAFLGGEVVPDEAHVN